MLRSLLIVILLAVGMLSPHAASAQQRVVTASKPSGKAQKPAKFDNDLKNLCFNPLGVINTARRDATIASIRATLDARSIAYKYSYDRTANFGIADPGNLTVIGRKADRCRIELGLRSLKTRYYFVFRSEKEADEFQNRLATTLTGMGAKLHARNVAKMPVYRSGKWQNLELALSVSRPVKMKPKGEKKYKAWTVTLTTDLPSRKRTTHTTTLSHLRPMSGSLFGIEGLTLRTPFATMADSVASRLIPARISADRISTIGTADGLDIILPVPGVAWCGGLKSTDEALYDNPAWTLYEMQFDPVIVGDPDSPIDYSKMSNLLYDRLIGEIRASDMHAVKTSTKLLKKMKIDKNIYKSTKEVWMVPNGAVTDFYILRRPAGHYTITILALLNK